MEFVPTVTISLREYFDLLAQKQRADALAAELQTVRETALKAKSDAAIAELKAIVGPDLRPWDSPDTAAILDMPEAE